LRLDFFNVLNHPEFAQPTFADGATNINRPTFGQITPAEPSAALLHTSASSRLG
jgi:hypothetical protein